MLQDLYAKDLGKSGLKRDKSRVLRTYLMLVT